MTFLLRKKEEQIVAYLMKISTKCNEYFRRGNFDRILIESIRRLWQRSAIDVTVFVVM